MESFATLIKSRSSTRKFTNQLLNPEQVEMIRKCWPSCQYANRQVLRS